MRETEISVGRTLAPETDALGPGGNQAADDQWPDADGALTTRQIAWRNFRRHKLAVASAIVLLIMVIAVCFAGQISRYSYQQLHLSAELQGPSTAHWLGTDNLGRDELSRLLYGGRISLLVGLSVSLSAGIIGTMIGAIAGYFGGLVDNVLMRITDLFLTIPLLVILIIGSTLLGGDVIDIVVILTLFFWMYTARIVRGVFLTMKEQEFVEAARALGTSRRRIIFVQMLPNAAGPILVSITLGVAGAILTESALSFLGFGIQPPTPSWGNMLNDAQDYFQTAPWMLLAPGLAILITVLAVNFLGDGLRDALDPHTSRPPSRRIRLAAARAAAPAGRAASPAAPAAAPPAATAPTVPDQDDRP